MKQQEFVRSLSVSQRAELTQKSDMAGYKHLAVHVGGIVLLATLVLLKLPLWPVLMLPLGVLIVFLFTLLHETMHRTPFATAAVNDRVAMVCGFLLFLGPSWFRCFHFAHHRYTQNPEKDPELSEAKPQTPAQYVLHISGLPVWRAQMTTLLKNALGNIKEDYVPAAKRASVVQEARVFLSLYLLLFVLALSFQWQFVLTVWIVPVLLGQPFLRLYLLAEHGRCAFVDNVFANTRTTFSNRLVRRLAWNMPYHAEHHAFPSVPFYKLQELHVLMQESLQETEPGYLSFSRKYIEGLARGGSSD